MATALEVRSPTALLLAATRRGSCFLSTFLPGATYWGREEREASQMRESKNLYLIPKKKKKKSRCSLITFFLASPDGAGEVAEAGAAAASSSSSLSEASSTSASAAAVPALAGCCGGAPTGLPVLMASIPCGNQRPCCEIPRGRITRHGGLAYTQKSLAIVLVHRHFFDDFIVDFQQDFAIDLLI